MPDQVQPFAYPSRNLGNQKFEPSEIIQMDVEGALHQFLGLPADEVKTIVIAGAWRGDEVNSFLQYKNAEIICFEPNPENFDYLKKRFEGNPRVICLPIACGSTDGEAALHEADMTGNDSLLPIVDSGNIVEKTTHPVIVKRLDHVAELQGKKIDLLWMDVQGFEQEVLGGAGSLLDDCRAVFSEVYDANLDYEKGATYQGIKEILFARDFKLLAEGVSAGPRGVRGGNALFVKNGNATSAAFLADFEKRIGSRIKKENFKRKIFSSSLPKRIIGSMPVSLKIKIKKIFGL